MICRPVLRVGEPVISNGALTPRTPSLSIRVSPSRHRETRRRERHSTAGTTAVGSEGRHTPGRGCLNDEKLAVAGGEYDAEISPRATDADGANTALMTDAGIFSTAADFK